ncbi:MAG: helix-turn-helix domain-containing protein [Alphaproteobacteria bacterium]|nr:helix-turn-helix domain-containing protein [Alphaproteobacteria bacterium]
MSMIRTLREAKELTQAQLAELAGTSQPQVRRLEAGERRLSKEWAQRLAPHLGVEAAQLMFGEDVPVPSPVEMRSGTSDENDLSVPSGSGDDRQTKDQINIAHGAPVVSVASGMPMQSNGEGVHPAAHATPANARLGAALPDPVVKIPVFGQAVGGIDGEFVMNGDRLEDVFAPPILSSVAEAYAVYVAGESMEPRYFDGEIVFVNPVKRVRRGDFVVAQIQAEEHGPRLAYVKRFVRWNAQVLVLSQYNPEKELHFAASQVVSVHLAVMGGAV